MLGLTKKQHAVLKYIQDHILINHYSPSFRNIQEYFNFSSVGTVYNYIKILKRKGLISSEKEVSRSLKPVWETTEKYFGLFKLPLVGIIQAGFPIELFEKSQEIELCSFVARSPTNTYALEVKGDGFIDELIADKDVIVLEARQKVNDGETIILSLNKYKTMIKKIFYVESYVRLEAITPHHQPIILREEDFTIQGAVVSIIRKL